MTTYEPLHDHRRLHQLERGRWVDLDEVVAVETFVGMLEERRVRLTLRHGSSVDIVVGAKPGTGNPRTDEEKDAELGAWMGEHLGGLLQGIDQPPPSFEELAAQVGLDITEGTDRS